MEGKPSEFSGTDGDTTYPGAIPTLQAEISSTWVYEQRVCINTSRAKPRLACTTLNITITYGRISSCVRCNLRPDSSIIEGVGVGTLIVR